MKIAPSFSKKANWVDSLCLRLAKPRTYFFASLLENSAGTGKFLSANLLNNHLWLIDMLHSQITGWPMSAFTLDDLSLVLVFYFLVMGVLLHVSDFDQVSTRLCLVWWVASPPPL